MAKRPAQQISSPRDVDMLMLIREEEVYAGRIRDALIFTECRMQRPVVPLVSREQRIRESRRALYTRPTSLAERTEEEDSILDKKGSTRTCRSSGRPIIARQEESDTDASSIGGAMSYINPPIDRRRTVDDNDAIYSAASVARGRVEFTYDDLVATRENRKVTTVRALRRLANLWGINPKLNKEEMLSQLITEYARRYPDEVEAYEARRSTTRPGRPRRHPRRR